MWIKKTAVMLYGGVAYAAFFASFVYMMGFVGGLFVPKGIDSGAPAPVADAILINAGLILLFGLQHSIMARPAFKRWIEKAVPTPVERSTYVLAASAMLALTMWQWRPMTTELWNVTNTAARSLIYAAYGLGWFLALYSSFLINHFDLFGLRQVFLFFKGKAYAPIQMKVVSLYRLVRNPLMLGLLIAFWSAPVMTYGRLLFASGMTLYILIGIYFEERTLSADLGATYRAYRKRTPMLIPVPTQSPSTETIEDAENA
jgi:protein-S-isoprenylcysteine O-methyltransferase Ste14